MPKHTWEIVEFIIICILFHSNKLELGNNRKLQEQLRVTKYVVETARFQKWVNCDNPDELDLAFRIYDIEVLHTKPLNCGWK